MEVASSPVGIFVALVLYTLVVIGLSIKWYHEALKEPGKIEALEKKFALAKLKVQAKFVGARYAAQELADQYKREVEAAEVKFRAFLQREADKL